MTRTLAMTALLLLGPAAALWAQAETLPRRPAALCADVRELPSHRNATERELRCVYGAAGPGRFGLLSYVEVPVYQPATPLPGTHMVGVPGQPAPRADESFEAWEWRLLRTRFGPEAHRVHRDLSLLDPEVGERVVEFETRLRRAGVSASRRETWRAPARQAHLFQQGRARRGFLATATLTSWHCQVDSLSRPAGRAVDYHVPSADLPRFHEIAAEVGLRSFGADSNDPGHVFLPPAEAVPALHLALLRTLPRVPVVTLATGRPVDRPAARSALAAIRQNQAQFLLDPYIPVAAGRVVTQPFPAPLVARAQPARVGTPVTAAAPARRGLSRRAPRRRGADAGDARREP